MSGSASSWNFAPDRFILRSVRPKITKNGFFEAKRTIVIYGPSYKAAFDRFDRSIDRLVPSIRSTRYSKKRQKMKMQLLGELSQTSQDSFEFNIQLFEYNYWIPTQTNSGTIGLTRQTVALLFLQLFGKLSRSSQVSFESDSDSNESRDNRLNLSKSCVFQT